MIKCAGLIFDHSIQYIDHLAPFCSLMNWPLIVCENQVAELIRSYYPDLLLIESDVLSLKLPERIISCDTIPLLRAAFPGQEITSIWLPHGNSDKGWKSPYFEALKEEELVLVYGQKMVDFIHSKKIFPQTLSIGNFRWHYFQKHRSFYEKIVQKMFPKKGKNLLYAPTWEDSEDNGSFWKSFSSLASSVPSNHTLIVKLHPNTTKKFLLELEVLMGQSKENVTFLPEFPPIYPLLNICDAYIGDMSSIGYDFLKFDRPMLFIPVHGNNGSFENESYLHRCGNILTQDKLVLPLSDELSSIKKQTYDYTFDPTPDWNDLKGKINDSSRCGL